jgi:molybdenum cofactor guanylyltransferase
VIPVAGAVLAGGRSRRMGRDKALIEIDGRAMAARVAMSMAAAGCSPVFAVGGDAGSLGAIGLTVIDDRWPGEGPLGAIITALVHTEVPTVVAACDLPWLDEVTVRSLIRDVQRPGIDVDLVLATAHRDEPLCGCWMPSALGELRRSFDDGERAVHRAIARLKTVRVQVTTAAVRNVNEPADLPPV